MAIQTPEELFVWMLSDVRRVAERGETVFKELSQRAEDPDIKETLEAYAFLKNKTVSTLDECFKLIGKSPVSTVGPTYESIAEDWKKEFNEIQGPIAKTLFIGYKANQIMHWHIAEYLALTAMADYSGHYEVGALVETCLADYLALAERVRRRLRSFVEEERGGRMRKAA